MAPRARAPAVGRASALVSAIAAAGARVRSGPSSRARMCSVSDLLAGKRILVVDEEIRNLVKEIRVDFATRQVTVFLSETGDLHPTGGSEVEKKTAITGNWERGAGN